MKKSKGQKKKKKDWKHSVTLLSTIQVFSL